MIVLDEQHQSQFKKTTEISVEGPFGTHDTLRDGLKSFTHDLAPKHPLQTHLTTISEDDEQRRAILGQRALGCHVPLRMEFEKKTLNKSGRLGGLPSSRLMLDVSLGVDEDIDVSDILNCTALFYCCSLDDV